MFSKDQGLPDGYVYSVIEDDEGFLWISTGKGLVRFDGQFFEKIKTGRNQDDIIFASAKQKSGKLWFGTSAGDLYTCSKNSKTLNPHAGNCGASITRIISSEFNDELIIQTKGNGLFLMQDNAFHKIEGTQKYEQAGIEELNKDVILMLTSEGLFAVNYKKGVITKIPGIADNLIGFQKSAYKKHTFFLMARNGVLTEIEIGAGFEIIKRSTVFVNNEPVEIRAFCYKEDDQSLFLNTVNGQMTIVHPETGFTKRFEEWEFSASGNTFFVDKEQNLWLSTIGQGLYRFTKTPFELLRASEPAFAITGDKNGNLYYGTSSGVVIYDSTYRIATQLKTIDGQRLGQVNALHLNDHVLWIGTSQAGLFLWDLRAGKRIKITFSDIRNISVNSITARGNRVLVATNLDGVFQYQNGQLEQHFSVRNNLLHNNVFSAFLSNRNKVYYATHNTSFNYSFGKQLYELDTKSLGLISDFNDFAEDRKGEIFIATNGDGIYVLRNSTISTFEHNDKLESKFCGGLLCDKDDNLWIIERDHLYKYYSREKILHEIIFQRKNQVIFNPGASYMDEKGNVYFGTNKDVLKFNANRSIGELPQPYLEEVRVNDSIIDFNGINIWPSGTYQFSFRFSGLCLKNSEEVKFRYMLKGRDETWSALSSIRRADFPKLGEGDYSFRVMASNSDGFSSVDVSLYNFTIKPPFWKNPIFWLLIIVIVTALLITIIKARTATLVRAKERLEGIIEEKTRELRLEKDIIEKNNIHIEEQRQEIKDSITYAKRIQDALLQGKDNFDRDLFVLYNPRDIVSGDFYWLAEINGLKIIVVADCTGHGVPGALMSMIGTTLLNKIVLEKKITTPKEILNELDTEIKQALKQHTEDATRDGMDVCLCCFDKISGRLTYAGAMRPLFFVRENKLTEYIPTKHAIGGYNYGKTKSFEETVITTQRGDMFYLFSDGFADQFGGEKGKKLMLRNFKNMLIAISSLEPHEQQENLMQTYSKWKGDLDQVDDVLVIGFRT